MIIRHIYFILLGLIFILSAQLLIETKKPLSSSVSHNDETLSDASTIDTSSGDIYEYIDKHGNVVITNVVNKKAKKITLPPLKIESIPDSIVKTNTVEKNGQPPTIINSSYGKNARQTILLEELHHEEMAYLEAKQLLVENQGIKTKGEESKYNATMKTLEDSVTEHERNIALLKKQL